MKSKTLLIALSLTAFAFMSKSCMNEEKKSEKTEKQTTAVEEGKQEKAAKEIEMTPLEKGKSIAQATQAALGKNLVQAISERGTAGAIEFCNIEAIPITDSLAKIHRARVKRVSDKNRNPDNAANEAELAYIENAKNQLAADQNIKPQLKEEDGKWVAYYPILTNAMCLQCHGNADQVNKEALAKIQAHYPKDKALGYSENEVRGIWVIEMAN
ncbi:MAG: hypothetical protein CMC96_14075 [Flavobacteriales bacterium]|nr:hypothetical protein [Flavobacteriales bacterium]|tara:strand:- start:11995 stop:12633 length:639 start_codon:yes stop_codon:yes gene_type:complete